MNRCQHKRLLGFKIKYDHFDTAPLLRRIQTDMELRLLIIILQSDNEGVNVNMIFKRQAIDPPHQNQVMAQMKAMFGKAPSRRAFNYHPASEVVEKQYARMNPVRSLGAE